MAERLTARDLSELWNDEIRQEAPPSFWRLGDFLDDFRLRCSTQEEREKLVCDTPLPLETSEHWDMNAYLAAVVETLCREQDMTPPRWTESPDRFLHTPWFAGGLESL
jgi:hypothetical protein